MYIAVDFETYYDDNYSLTKLTPIQYILDDRFEVLCCSFAWRVGDQIETACVEAPRVSEALFDFRVADKLVVSHNALFDASILAWRYGLRPRMYGDTLAMARRLVAPVNGGKADLDSVAKHLGLPDKQLMPAKVKGMRFADLQQPASRGLWESLCAYATHDARLCLLIFEQLASKLPKSELKLIHLITRMTTDPQLALDKDVLVEALRNEQERKAALLKQAGRVMRAITRCISYDDPSVVRETLMSAAKLASIFERAGISVPTKISAATGQAIPAFAKTDSAFTDLLEGDDPVAALLAEARLGVKSTIEETRLERFLALAELRWPATARVATSPPPMPWPLRYGTAHTGRLAGEMKLNMQNLGRESMLRRALIAPPGKKILAVDASQIEARVLAYICEQTNIVKAFAERQDVYATMASAIFKMPINKTDHPKERLLGKLATLGLGYGMSSRKFQALCALPPNNLDVDEEMAVNVVETYRKKFATNIARTWWLLDEVISAPSHYDFTYLVNQLPKPMRHMLEFSCDYTAAGKTMSIKLPNGTFLNYYNLTLGDTGYTYTYGGKTKNIYGAKLIENITQALARIIVMDAALEVEESGMGLRLAGQCHDELIYVVDEGFVDEAASYVVACMSKSPSWARDIPLAAEAGVGYNYLEVK